MSTQPNFLMLSLLTLPIPLITPLALGVTHASDRATHKEPLAFEQSGLQQIALSDLVDNLMGKRPPTGGDHGPEEFCALFPDPMMGRRDSFSTQPVYAWYPPSGPSIDRIEIKDVSTFELVEEILLSEEDKTRGYVFHPADSPLPRGTKYQVYFLDDEQGSTIKLGSSDLYILRESGEQYRRLLPQFNGDPNVLATTEQQAQDYTEIFADEVNDESLPNLWMDVGRQILSFPELAPEFIEENYQQACRQSS